ncbi:sugar phosphate isomerase/epimerase family protein [Paenibacillus sp. GCM10023252]|uniref:sugar phosphate isomerase/epimerase family protein n=1 Tax=Paenibacillus sp. GCM10023252 TaxID=3252649 RepID=UPI0036234E47
MTMTITCFADEISSELTEQLDVLAEVGVSHLEIRNVWGKNVLALTDEELSRISAMLKERGFRVSSIGSPIGKYPITEPFEAQLTAMDRAVAAAKKLETAYIRIFSYFIPEGEDRNILLKEALDRMKQLAQTAEKNGVVLILENDSGLFGTTPEECVEIFNHCDSSSLCAAFDAGNYVIEGVKPMDEAYPKISPYLEYVHVKDATKEPRLFVPAGKGEGQLEELLLALNEKNFTGFLSVEPHLAKYLPDATNPERVKTAIQALQGILDKHQIAWQ